MAYRGQYSIFSNIFTTVSKEELSTPKRKGRSEELNNTRNEFLLNRYYYYCHFFDKKLSYHFIITRLANEVFLSEHTVTDIIENNYAMLSQIKLNKPDIAFLKEKYPHIVWDLKTILYLILNPNLS